MVSYIGNKKWSILSQKKKEKKQQICAAVSTSRWYRYWFSMRKFRLLFIIDLCIYWNKPPHHLFHNFSFFLPQVKSCVFLKFFFSSVCFTNFFFLPIFFQHRQSHTEVHNNGRIVCIWRALNILISTHKKKWEFST